MNINKLLHKYFEGETTSSEERELRNFFTKGIVPEELEVYRSFFTYFEEQKETANTVSKRKRPIRSYVWASIAAGFLLVLTIGGIQKYGRHFDNYVIIDGKRYTDIALAREQARQAFSEVSFTQEEIFDSLFD